MLHLWVQMPSPWSKSRPTYHAIASFQVVETMKFPNPDLESRNPANPRLGQVWHYRFEAAMPAGDIDSSRPLHCFAQIWSFHQLLVKIHYFQKGVAFPGHWRHFPIIGRHFPVNPPAFPDHWPAFPGHWFLPFWPFSPILDFFIKFCSKSTTSRIGRHFPVNPPAFPVAGISRSLVFAILAVFTNSWFFIKFCSKSTTSRRGWHFPVIGGISRSLAGISRSTPRHFPIIGRHFPVIGFLPFWPFSPISANDASGCKCGSQGHLMTDFVAVIQRKVCSEPLTSTLIEFS